MARVSQILDSNIDRAQYDLTLAYVSTILAHKISETSKNIRVPLPIVAFCHCINGICTECNPAGSRSFGTAPKRLTSFSTDQCSVFAEKIL